MTREELAGALREAAYLEGDFVLRSGRRSKYYLDKYLFETRPDILRPLGEAGLRVSTAVCVVDREEGGVDAFARQAVRLRPLFTASELLKTPANPHG